MSDRSWNGIDVFAERICDDRCGVPGENDECGAGRVEWLMLTEREKDQWRKTAELLADVVENDDEVYQETVSELSEAQDKLHDIDRVASEIKSALAKMLGFVNGLRRHPFVEKGAKRAAPPDLKAFIDEMLHQLNAVETAVEQLPEDS